MYARRYGKEAAKDKPNYRYYYHFVVRKNTDMYYMNVYCNSDDAEKVFSVCVENINEL